MQKNILLELKPIQRFISGVGKQIEKYFGKDKGCIIGLEDDGVFYGQGLYLWLSKKNKKVNFTTLNIEEEKLRDEERVQGRKVLVVDNDIVTGTAYRKVMDFLRERSKDWKIRDIKYATLSDRMKLADFSVEEYTALKDEKGTKLDNLDLKIIQILAEDGRKSFVEIAKETKLSAVGIKNRVERLLKNDVLRIKGALSIKNFYSISANINIEADKSTAQNLIEKFKKNPAVYNLVEVSGSHNLIVGILAPDLREIGEFINKEIRQEKGLKHIDIDIGELPIIPAEINKTTF